MIGYYVHHRGLGHLHRANAIARSLHRPVAGISALERPVGWPGAWLQLAPDDEGSVVDPTANGRLHWAPRGDTGLCSRMSDISSWIRSLGPAAMVSDVSVEISLLARLHGVPVVSVVLPGVRDDPAHVLGYEISDALVGFWPPGVTGMLPGLPSRLRKRVQEVGALSRFGDRELPAREPGGRRVTLLSGSDGGAISREDLDAARRATPDWDWTVLHPDLGVWSDDPFDAIAGADVVITHAGQSALADVATARRPAVVVPEERPHDEQRTTAAALVEGGWPVLVADRYDGQPWDRLLAEAAALDGSRWARWADGQAPQRVAEIVYAVSLDR